MLFSRNDKSLMGKWWYDVDRITLFSLFTLIILGIVLNFAATPSIAHRLGYDTFYFVKRHTVYVIPTFLILISVSFLNNAQLKKFSFIMLFFFIFLLLITPIIGIEIKGAKRWILLGGVSFQISEFLKPCFSVVSGLLLAKYCEDKNFPGLFLSMGILGFIILCLLMQPDLGMSLIFLSSWFCQLFIVGISYIWITAIIASTPFGILLAYFIFPHVARRINLFFQASDAPNIYGEHYQITRSLEAFIKGGIFGKGPGEGTIKRYVPDAHSEFIFSVAGEEFGLLFCLFIILVFAIIMYRVISRIYYSSSLFVIVTITGLISQLVMHSLINMASSLNIIPTKGMTLPFISYGGSSMLALALTCGMILSLTRKQSQMVTKI